MKLDEAQIGRIFEDSTGKRFVVIGVDRDGMVEYLRFLGGEWSKRHIDSLAEWTRIAIDPITGDTIRGDAMYERIEAQQASTAKFNEVMARGESVSCETCRFWVQQKWLDGDEGECRRHPPKVRDFPVTGAEKWCGEHQPANAPHAGQTSPTTPAASDSPPAPDEHGAPTVPAHPDASRDADHGSA